MSAEVQVAGQVVRLRWLAGCSGVFGRLLWCGL